MGIHRRVRRRASYGFLGLCLVFLLTLPGVEPLNPMVLHPMSWMPSASMAAEMPSNDVQGLLAQGRDNYVRGQLSAAAALLETALATAEAQNDALGKVMVLSNLALVYGQMGEWSEADEAIADSLQLLDQSENPDLNWQRVTAQTLTVQGRLQLGQGDADAALASWEQAAEVFQIAGDEAGQIRSELYQARAWQAKGFYRRAVDDVLKPLNQRLAADPPSSLKATSLRSLAEAFIVAESLDAAWQAAQESLAVADALNLVDDIAAARLTLGNIAYARAQELQNQNAKDETIDNAIATALEQYRLVSEAGEAGAYRLESQLNQLVLLIDFDRTQEAVQLWPELYEQVSTIPPDQAGIYTRINLANSLARLARQQVPGAPDWEQVIDILEIAQRDAIELQDARTEAHVLGYLGTVYKDKGDIEADSSQLETAKQFTEEALFLAESVNAANISYLWYEQLGDVNVKLDELAGSQVHQQAAIAAYDGAVTTLKSLRRDLLKINPEIQFSFQKSIEPLHRKLVTLLLEEEANPSQTNLIRTRTVLESLQIEELNNYLRSACLNSQEVSVEDISGEKRVAVIYPIVLSDRLGIIANLPTSNRSDTKQVNGNEPEAGELKYYTSPLDSEALEQDAARMLRQMVFVDFDVLDTAERLYNLLFPADLVQALEASSPNTLVFIPDGVLRNIPIAALFDGESYLIEKYSIAITPGLQLLNPKPLQSKRLTALTFGLSEAVEGWSPLPNVASELEAIDQEISVVDTFLNDQFTYEKFEEVLKSSSAPIIHLATHGKFSSQLEETFLQAWDQRISVDDLSEWLQSDRTEPLELLVLSACETATGDQRAALGLAGMAIRAGARSTVASLWQVDDAATSFFMTKFYQELSAKSGNKAEALQSAQKYLIEEFRDDFGHPYYWAPFVLIGNWL